MQAEFEGRSGAGRRPSTSKLPRRYVVKTIQMFALTAGLSLATSMLAGATAKAPGTDSARKSGAATTFHSSKQTVLIARGEREPGDDHGRRGREDRRRHDDGKGHRFNPLMARGEPQPGDDKGKGGKDDGSGHRAV
jgi:hypothetical protein